MEIYILLVFVLCFGVGKGQLTNLPVSDDGIDESVSSSHWILYTGPNVSDGISVGLYNLSQLTQHEKFNRTIPTTLYIHGYLENQMVHTVQLIREAYISYRLQNLLLLDWAVAASGGFVGAVKNEIKIGKVCGKILADVFKGNFLNISTFHGVGHSLGAQLLSVIGRTLIANDLKLERATGLDAAGPLTYGAAKILFGQSHLTHADADFVDLIITDMFVYGRAISTGTANFYMNGGFRPQPGCSVGTIPFSLEPDDLCSHQHSVIYWAYTVRSPRAEPRIQAIKGFTYIDFLDGMTQGNEIVEAGLYCPTSAKGNYFVRTSGADPYGLGNDGTHP